VANDGNIIFVHSGTYSEILDIKKSITLQGENKKSTIIQRPENQSNEIINLFSSAEGLIISGFTFDNSIFYGPYGNDCIKIHTDNNVISDNIFISGTYADIHLDGALNNIIINNNFTSNGILIRRSGTPELKNWNTHTIENNIINGMPLHYFKNNNNGEIISSKSGQVILANCSNFIIENLNLENSCYSIQFGYSENNTILNCTLENNNRFGSGIRLLNSHSNNIFNNIISKYGDGIILTERSTNNLIKNNELTENTKGYYQNGFSHNNEIINNTIISNDFSGVYLDSYSMDNNVSFNQILNNRYGLILALVCDNNMIYTNNIINSETGISIESSSNNSFVFNNFINNSINAKIKHNKTNNWDVDELGNYWSDYDDEDLNEDGIGDSPYIISDLNQDNYPLMNPVDN